MREKIGQSHRERTLKSTGMLVQQRTTPANGADSMDGTAGGQGETWDGGRQREGWRTARQSCCVSCVLYYVSCVVEVVALVLSIVVRQGVFWCVLVLRCFWSFSFSPI